MGYFVNRPDVLITLDGLSYLYYTRRINHIVGRRIIRAEWVGNLSIDDNEGYLLTFDDGSSVLFSWYQAYDCVGVLHEIHAAQPLRAVDTATPPSAEQNPRSNIVPAVESDTQPRP